MRYPTRLRLYADGQPIGCEYAAIPPWLRPAVFDLDIVALDITDFAEPLPEQRDDTAGLTGAAVRHADATPGSAVAALWPAATNRPPTRTAKTSRRLVCRERSIVRDDGGRFTTPPPSRLEARSRLGDKAANELGAPVVSSIPAQLPGLEPASARKGREDDRAVLRWN